MVWVISEKNILQTDFEGKNYCNETPGEKKYPTLKKNVTPLHVREKSITRGLGKLILPNANHPYPPQKSNNRAAPNTAVCPRSSPLWTFRQEKGPWRRGARRSGCISRLVFIPVALSANGSYCTLKYCLSFLTEIKVTTSILVAV